MISGDELTVLQDVAAALAAGAYRLPATSPWKASLLRARRCVLEEIGGRVAEPVGGEPLAGSAARS